VPLWHKILARLGVGFGVRLLAKHDCSSLGLTVNQQDHLEKAALIMVFIVTGTMIVHQVANPSWKKFTSAEGSFSVLMPKKPKTENESVVANGITMETHRFSAWNRTNAQFTVAYVDAPVIPTADTSERMLDRQLQSLTHGDAQRILFSETLTVNGYPARTYRVLTEEGLQADQRLYLVKRRLYILLVVHDKGANEDDVQKFFDSFTFEPRE
jgi:hypothetical protein